VDFPRSWEEETFFPAMVRREDGLSAKISALKSGREPPIGSCRKTAPATANSRKEKPVDAFSMVRLAAGMP